MRTLCKEHIWEPVVSTHPKDDRFSFHTPTAREYFSQIGNGKSNLLVYHVMARSDCYPETGVVSIREPVRTVPGTS